MAKGRFRQAIEAWYEDFDVGGRFSRYSEEKTDVIEKAVVEDNSEIFELLRVIKTGDTKVDNYIEKVTKPKRFAFIIFVIPAVMAAANSFIGAILSPIAELIQHAVNHAFLPRRFDINEFIQIRRRGTEPEIFRYEDALDLGWPVERINSLDNATKTRPGIPELITLFRRKEISQARFIELLDAEGFDTNFVGELLSATELLPGLSDLLSLQVREAFDEDIARRFELDSGDISDFQRLSDEIGVRSDMPKFLWRAHWQLPAVGQAFEMFQRLRDDRSDNPFTFEDLQELLRVADISPFFRVRLLEIAYRPVARIDIRRMYREGQISFEEMIERNMDFGYSPDNARLLAEMERSQGQTDERDLTLGLIKKAYSVKQLTRPEAEQSLLDLGFESDNAGLILDIIDFDIQEDQIADLKRHLELLFVEGEINETQVRGRLAGAGAVANEITDYMQKITLKRARKIKTTSKSELEDFYEDNIIDVNQLRDGLQKIGWTNQRVGWFVELVDLKIQKKLQREADKARNEQATLARREGVRTYQLAKSEIDTLIAEHNADIADIKVARHLIEEDEEKEELKLAIDEIKAEIAILKLDKALIRVEFFQ